MIHILSNVCINLRDTLSQLYSKSTHLTNEKTQIGGFSIYHEYLNCHNLHIKTGKFLSVFLGDVTQAMKVIRSSQATIFSVIIIT